jgi:hypothetical protein
LLPGLAAATGQRRRQAALLTQSCRRCGSCDSFPAMHPAMSQDDKLIDLNTERAKRVHDLNEKRLNEVRQAFEQAMPLGKAKKKPKNKPKKR